LYKKAIYEHSKPTYLFAKQKLREAYLADAPKGLELTNLRFNDLLYYAFIEKVEVEDRSQRTRGCQIVPRKHALLLLHQLQQWVLASNFREFEISHFFITLSTHIVRCTLQQ